MSSGDWLGRGAGARTRMQVAIDSDDFGELLGGFGFGGQLAGGDGTAKFDASWAGSPAAFKLEALDGTLAVDAKDGRLVEIEPGAGRVLGLLSVAQLPKRLTLDFRDFFSKGFAFNRIDGHVRVAGGSARSDDLRIDGPAAQIRIRGAADLRAQTFDQTIEVLPKAGNLLTVAGAIAGRPGGRGDRRGGQCGAEQAVAAAGGQDLSRDRAMEGSQGRGAETRAVAGQHRAGPSRRPVDSGHFATNS